jgi:hypothetical protein
MARAAQGNTLLAIDSACAAVTAAALVTLQSPELFFGEQRPISGPRSHPLGLRHQKVMRLNAEHSR